MSAFKGFSDVQIRGEEKNKLGSRKSKPSPRKSKTPTLPISETIPPEARLSAATDAKTPEDSAANPDLLSGLESEENQKPESPTTPVIPDKEHAKKSEILQERQEKIKAENNKKKELLTKAINERKKRTTEETQKLKHVQVELHHLDQLVANDVKLLRKAIETASIEFVDAQKHYDRTEKEYVEAKLRLHQKSERKELLVEHLCAIIEQSELRKSKKLSELMAELNLDN